MSPTILNPAHPGPRGGDKGEGKPPPLGKKGFFSPKFYKSRTLNQLSPRGLVGFFDYILYNRLYSIYIIRGIYKKKSGGAPRARHGGANPSSFYIYTTNNVYTT